MTCQQRTNAICNISTNCQNSFFTTWNGRPHSPLTHDSQLVSCHVSRAAGGGGGRGEAAASPTRTLMPAAELNSNVTQNQLDSADTTEIWCSKDFKSLLNCPPGRGEGGGDRREKLRFLAWIGRT